MALTNWLVYRLTNPSGKPDSVAATKDSNVPSVHNSIKINNSSWKWKIVNNEVNKEIKN